jgi:hypothetical protein
MRIELTGYDRPARLASTTTMRQADMDGTLTFEPAPPGTRMHWSWRVQPKGACWLLVPLISWMGSHQEQTIWTSMKLLPAALSEDEVAAFHEDESAALVEDRRRGSTSPQRTADSERSLTVTAVPSCDDTFDRYRVDGSPSWILRGHASSQAGRRTWRGC